MKKTVLVIITVLIINWIQIVDVQANSQPSIVIQAMAENEIQPKLLHDKKGRTHLIYFKMEQVDSRLGNLYYKQYKPNVNKWSEPIKISSKTYRRPDVIATAKMAVDGQGRLHVVWLDHKPTAYLYSRSDSAIEKFETPRAIIKKYIDGAEANAVVSTFNNQVNLSWMAGHDENLRTVYSMTSIDNGETFGPESMIGDQSLGGCACCAFASSYTDKGELLVAYRSAENGDNRDMQLLSSYDSHKSTTLIDKWKYNACPVSTNSMVQDSQQNTWITWETKGKIYKSMRSGKSINPIMVSPESSIIRQKHPVIAINNAGNQLIAWSEGDGYFSGGELKLKAYGPQSQELKTPSTHAMLPALFSSASVVALADGSFLVMY